jgi:hypothetical protein
MDHLRKICELHTVGIQRTRVVRFITELAVAPPGDGLREHLREQQLLEARRFAAIVEEGKAQGCIRPDIDSEEVAWRIMAVHWLEAMARLHGLEDQVLTGFSTRRFQSILEEIATESATESAAEFAAQPCATTVPDGVAGPAAEPLAVGSAPSGG